MTEQVRSIYSRGVYKRYTGRNTKTNPKNLNPNLNPNLTLSSLTLIVANASRGQALPSYELGGSGRIFDSKGVQLIADTENGILHSAEVEGEVADPLDSGLQDDGGRPENHPILNLHRQSLRDNARNAQSGDGDATHGRECAKPWISDDDYGLSDSHVLQSESLSDGLAMTSYDVYDKSILSDDHVLSSDRQGHGRGRERRRGGAVCRARHR